MSTALFSFLKKLSFFIVFLFALPLSLMAQDVRSSSETSLTLETNSSNQLGDIVFAPVIGNLKVLFILAKKQREALARRKQLKEFAYFNSNLMVFGKLTIIVL